MMKVEDIIKDLIQNIQQPAGIIDENHVVYYINNSFREFFKINKEEENKVEYDAIKLINLEFTGKKLKKFQKIIFPEGKEKISIVVYLLNEYKMHGNFFLIMVVDEKKETQKSYHLEVSNLNDDSEKFRSEKISEEFNELLGKNIEFKKALVIAQRAAKSNISVLITGESGTGKEILARAIHKVSLRSSKPLIDVNCAAIPDSLIESELFGYEKGAFTGAKTEGSKGYFDEAHEGTLLLDEVGDASLQTQSKLLRVLESGTFKRVGGTRNIKVDVRIISSTNRDLSLLIEQKKFREDLFFRLNTFRIFLPPLRERREDIALLVDYFLKSNEDIVKRDLKFSSEAMEMLNSYHWPGNVRELKGVVSYAVNMSREDVIRPISLPNFLFKGGKAVSSSTNLPERTCNIGQAKENMEKKLIKEALETTENKTMAIRKLGVSRRTFYQKIKKYGLY